MLAAGLALVVLSAILHASAQALIKGSRDKRAFAWLMLGVQGLGGLPFVFSIGRVEPIGWLILAASGAAEALYFMALTKAYSIGDFSTVYPVARGSGPLFTLLWGLLLLGERPRPMGVAGILVVVCGIYLAAMPSLAEWRKPFAGPGGKAAPWALATGFLISIYTTLDKSGMRHFDPATYLCLVLLIAWILQAPLFLRAERRGALKAELTGIDAAGRRSLDLKACGRVIASAVLAFAAYALVLAALRLSPASYVASTREIGVVFGAWIGVRFFRERGGPLKIVASALILLGVALIALAK
jgi:drug/metabolite transporter (DMT)-like permease